MSETYSRNPDVIFRRVAGEFILVPIRQKAVDLKSVYTLNDVAAFVWELIDGARTAPVIADRLTEEFDVAPAQARSDVGEILSHLEALGLIRKA